MEDWKPKQPPTPTATDIVADLAADDFPPAR